MNANEMRAPQVCNTLWGKHLEMPLIPTSDSPKRLKKLGEA